MLWSSGQSREREGKTPEITVCIKYYEGPCDLLWRGVFCPLTKAEPHLLCLFFVHLLVQCSATRLMVRSLRVMLAEEHIRFVHELS